MKTNIQKGFTLIELIAVLGIFAILTSVVVFNYSRFRSETILTNMAYEVALSLREAQIYGVSARNAKGIATPDFKLPYGILFKDDSNQYFLFADTNGQTGDGEFTGTDCINSGGDTCITPYTMQQNIKIDRICTDSEIDIDSASVLFRRPNPEPIISAGSAITPSFVQIKLVSQSNSIRYVLVYNNGQVAVLSESQKTGCN
jgi:prepilin-type N-terminal cleavage/methylation domain-containing protein